MEKPRQPLGVFDSFPNCLYFLCGFPNWLSRARSYIENCLVLFDEAGGEGLKKILFDIMPGVELLTYHGAPKQTTTNNRELKDRNYLLRTKFS